MPTYIKRRLDLQRQLNHNKTLKALLGALLFLCKLALKLESLPRRVFFFSPERASQQMKIVERGWIDSPSRLFDLAIIDFGRDHRTNRSGYWGYKSSEALDCCFGWLNKVAVYTVVEIGDWTSSDVEEFPEWDHVGNHVFYAKEYWKWFHTHFPQGELFLSDSPDFWGRLNGHYFYGDFGLVSPHAFVNSIKMMDAHDLWISVQWRSHILIEPLVSIWDLFEATLPKPKERPRPMVKRPEPILSRAYTQLGFAVA